MSGVPFFPSIDWSSVRIVPCHDGEVIIGPDGSTLTVRKGKAVQRGNCIYIEQGDYDALKHKLAASSTSKGESA